MRPVVGRLTRARRGGWGGGLRTGPGAVAREGGPSFPVAVPVGRRRLVGERPNEDGPELALRWMAVAGALAGERIGVRAKGRASAFGFPDLILRRKGGGVLLRPRTLCPRPGYGPHPPRRPGPCDYSPRGVTGPIHLLSGPSADHLPITAQNLSATGSPFLSPAPRPLPSGPNLNSLNSVKRREGMDRPEKNCFIP